MTPGEVVEVGSDQCHYPESHARHSWGWNQRERRPFTCLGVEDPSGLPPLPIDPHLRRKELVRRGEQVDERQKKTHWSKEGRPACGATQVAHAKVVTVRGMVTCLTCRMNMTLDG